jgi:hypothetical protein
MSRLSILPAALEKLSRISMLLYHFLQTESTDELTYRSE